jgi:hypothetical protein
MKEDNYGDVINMKINGLDFVMIKFNNIFNKIVQIIKRILK